MDVQTAYDQWAAQYDSNHNRTRDAEAQLLRVLLAGRALGRVLELGCGTGKNTEWLAQYASHITAVDLSAAMLALAQEKVQAAHVQFVQADLLQHWQFVQRQYDWVVCSLVLEHIKELGPIFKNMAHALSPDGQVYIAELHPYKQYLGSQARFDTAEGRHLVPCHTHHLSDFVGAAQGIGLQLRHLTEIFDANAPAGPPRLLAMVFAK